ncbi:PadR family transcriptional regulator [Lihuaxuella thermophila]|uniref:DNA-binding transcriptional regulator, PadR family n=1 Tax=Lihuaxuella thermophila TaxID=1173111 RepID=A0A1H8B7A2_9BACL|nr:PadR family transcriptional regulator [Lihuaxuella thermophila]SEM78732.1 DNA-binding transcriptional regulator, PadR family [Lihuaxuella thermophila]
MKSKIKKSPIALAILALLIEEPMHPYRMQQLLKERGKHDVINVRHRTSIYQTIDRLRRDGAIAIQGKKQNDGKPELTVYEITDEGRTAVFSWLREMLSTAKQEFLEFPAAVSFLMLLTPEDVIAQFQTRVSGLEDKLAQIDGQLQTAKEQGIPRLFLLETEYQRDVLAAELEWVRSVIRDIQTEKLQWNEEWLRTIAKKFTSTDQNEGHETESGS